MFIDKLLSIVAGLLFLFVLSCDGPNTETQQAATVTTSPTDLYDDPVFWDYAASSNMLQTALSQLAIEKGETDTVRTRAERAAKFHSKALKQLKSFARKSALLQLPDSLSGADYELVKEFEVLEGEEFNTRYKAFLISSHQAQLARYQEALKKAEEPKLRSWIRSFIEHIQGELSAATATDSLQQE